MPLRADGASRSIPDSMGLASHTLCVDNALSQTEIDMSDVAPLPAGDYCILELFGHVTLVGRYKEVELFATKMMAIEPLFQDTLLSVVFHGGAAIYRLTPCEPETARKHQPTHGYQLPPAIRANVPAALLPAPSDYPGYSDHSEDNDDEIPI